MMYTEKKDGKTGKIERVNAVEYYDFAHQDYTLLKEYDVYPGDTLTTRCFFKNPRNNVLRFGLASEEEMCIDFLLYYPAFDGGEHCASEESASNAFMTQTVLAPSDLGARVFGVEAGTPDHDQCTGSAITVKT